MINNNYAKEYMGGSPRIIYGYVYDIYNGYVTYTTKDLYAGRDLLIWKGRIIPKDSISLFLRLMESGRRFLLMRQLILWQKSLLHIKKIMVRSQSFIMNNTEAEVFLKALATFSLIFMEDALNKRGDHAGVQEWQHRKRTLVMQEVILSKI